MQSESTAPKKEPRRRLKSTATCDVCGTAYHPIRKSQRFCSNPCRMLWWKSEVSPKALESANRKKDELAVEGSAQSRDGSHWTSDTPNSRSKKGRRERDRAVVEQATQVETDEEDEGKAWAERARYWQSQGADETDGPEAFNVPKEEGQPLVLVGHGVQLRVDNGALLVRNGFTHYPQEREEHRFFPADRKLPSRIVTVDCDGSVTLDVLVWLARHVVPLIQLDYRGKVMAISSRSMQL